MIMIECIHTTKYGADTGTHSGETDYSTKGRGENICENKEERALFHE